MAVSIARLTSALADRYRSERFLTEIKTTAKLQHPHILPLLDSGAADGLLFYVMPYARGAAVLPIVVLNWAEEVKRLMAAAGIT